MNLFDRIEKTFLGSWDFLMDLVGCFFFFGGHDPMNLIKIHELENQELSYFLL